MILRLIADRLRAALLRLRGASIGAKCRIGPRVMVRGARGITTGTRVEIEHDVFFKLVTERARLRLGDFTFIGRGCELDVSDDITIGAHTLLAPGVFITDHVHNMRAGIRLDEQGLRCAPVVIGSDVWIGTGSVILPGVTIGDGAVIGANSVVTRDVEPNAVVAGSPARLLRYRGEDR